LFIAVVSATVDEASRPVADQVAGIAATADVPGALLGLARSQLRLVMRPEMMRLRRMVIGEGERFPELARLFHQRGPGRTQDLLSVLFGELMTMGVLTIDDPVKAARRFNWLVMAEPVNRAMLLGLAEPPSIAQIEQWAADGVEAFLAIYPAVPAGAEGAA
jgi:hypothetical protein